MDNRLRQKWQKDPPPSQTQEAIREVCRELEAVQARFSVESDNDLIEACIYETEALRARYRYLLRQAKKNGITAAVRMPFSESEGIG